MDKQTYFPTAGPPRKGFAIASLVIGIVRFSSIRTGLTPMFDTTAHPVQAGTFGTGNASFYSNPDLFNRDR